MSVFGGKKKSVRSSSPTKLTILLPSAVVKRKPPFVAASKSLSKTHHSDYFGAPRPLSPVRGTAAESMASIVLEMEDHDVQVMEPNLIAASHLHLLQRQSIRWINLSATLWSLIVLDAKRSVEETSVSQFLDVMLWRAHGNVSEEEFSVLFAEWIFNGEPVQTHQSVLSKKKRQSVGVFILRQLLLEKKISESDLDLFIGMIINETNNRLLNFSVRYTPQQPGGGGRQSLELCTGGWLSACEELFFALDTTGYGVLGFDEVYFFCACLTIGIQGWSNEEEMESDLSLSTLTATSLQFFLDSGANICVHPLHTHGTVGSAVYTEKETSGNKLSAELFDDMDFDISRTQLQDLSRALGFSPLKKLNIHGSSSSSYSPIAGKNVEKSRSSKFAITISMFKKYLMKMNIGEALMSTLLSHIKLCVEKLSKVAHGAESDIGLALHASMSPLDESIFVVHASGSGITGGGSAGLGSAGASGGAAGAMLTSIVGGIGSPRLWQQAVLMAAGYYKDSYNVSLEDPNYSYTTAAPTSAVTSSHVPSIVLFLLSDAQKYISGNFRAGGPEVWQANWWGEAAGEDGLRSLRRVDSGITGGGGNDRRLEVHDLAYKLWSYFSLWGKVGETSSGASRIRMPTSSGSLSANALNQLMRDPVYQMILQSLQQYKILQEVLQAALVDMTTTFFGLNRGFAPSVPMLCASLIPNPKTLLRELGNFGDIRMGITTALERSYDMSPDPVGSSYITEQQHNSAPDSPTTGAVISQPPSTPTVKFALSDLQSGGATAEVTGRSASISPPRRNTIASMQQVYPAPVALSTAGARQGDKMAAALTSKLSTVSSPVERRRLLSQHDFSITNSLKNREEEEKDELTKEFRNAEWVPLFETAENWENSNALSAQEAEIFDRLLAAPSQAEQIALVEKLKKVRASSKIDSDEVVAGGSCSSKSGSSEEDDAIFEEC
jgi:hypothetical protein